MSLNQPESQEIVLPIAHQPTNSPERLFAQWRSLNWLEEGNANQPNAKLRINLPIAKNKQSSLNWLLEGSAIQPKF
jgi:hypothetical protein